MFFLLIPLDLGLVYSHNGTVITKPPGFGQHRKKAGR